MRKVAIIGNGGVALAVEILSMAQRNSIEIVVINDTEQEKNKAFQPDPTIIRSYNYDFIEPPNYYEQQPSKFISKPKNNFKRR